VATSGSGSRRGFEKKKGRGREWQLVNLILTKRGKGRGFVGRGIHGGKRKDLFFMT